MSKHSLCSSKIIELTAIANWIGNQGWCPATGGNFSARIDENLCIVTASGVDKTALQEDDFLIVELTTGKVHSGSQKPSAETLLHTTLYELSKDIAAVLHTHSVAATVLSNYCQNFNSLIIHGYEMQKALKGVTSHEAKVCLPILENSQNMRELSAQLKQRWQVEAFEYGFLVQGHGLYAWGNSLPEAKRHLEGIEFLLSCELNRMLLAAR
jgi:methylthioribulose-1-phosphate dehydratase